jgi:predicted thioredoxin/glutaredoxin
MKIIIAATKTCNHRPLLEQELKKAGLEYNVKYFDENPEVIEKFKVKRSPLLIVDDELLSVGMPEHGMIEDLKEKDNS